MISNAAINAANRRHYAAGNSPPPHRRTVDMLLTTPTSGEAERYFASRATNDPGKVWNGDPSASREFVDTLINGLRSMKDADEREQLGTALEAKGYLPPGWRRNFGGVASTDKLAHLGSLTRDAMRDVQRVKAAAKALWQR